MINVGLTQACPNYHDTCHISYMYIVVDYKEYILSVFQKWFFRLVLVFDFECSKLTELPMTMVRLKSSCCL